MSKKRKEEKRTAKEAARLKALRCSRCYSTKEGKIHTPSIRETIVICGHCGRRKGVHHEMLRTGGVQTGDGQG